MNNISRQGLTVNSGAAECNHQSHYLNIYQFDGMTRHYYPNKCGCNEYDALMRRHLLPNLVNFNPDNQYLRMLRSSVLTQADLLRKEYPDSFHKQPHNIVMSKTRANIRERYRKAYSNLRNRYYVDKTAARITSFVKFEKLTEEKLEEGKPCRVIQFRSYEYLYTLKAYVMSHSEVIHNTSLKVGNNYLKHVMTKNFDTYGIADVLLQSWNSYRNPMAICCDHSKFDGHYNTQLLEIEHEYWNTLFKDAFLAKLLEMQLHNKGYTQRGIIYNVVGHRMSGEYTTSEGNSLLNYHMYKVFLEVAGIEGSIHVNGDDSVIIFDMEDLVKFQKLGLDFFNNFNMETTMDRICYDFREITYCQTSPIRVMGDNGLVWRMVKTPFRSMSRTCYTEDRYSKCINRYISGMALCELAVNSGVPILQAWSLFLLHDAKYAKPLGKIDKIPARSVEKGSLRTRDISDVTREDFAVAFGISKEMQIQYETELAGVLILAPLISYLKRYQNYHLN